MEFCNGNVADRFLQEQVKLDELGAFGQMDSNMLLPHFVHCPSFSSFFRRSGEEGSFAVITSAAMDARIVHLHNVQLRR